MVYYLTDLRFLLTFVGSLTLHAFFLYGLLNVAVFLKLLLHFFAFPRPVDCCLIHVLVYVDPSVVSSVWVFATFTTLSHLWTFCALWELDHSSCGLTSSVIHCPIWNFLPKIPESSVLTTCQNLIGGFYVWSVGSGGWRFDHSLDIAGDCILSWGFCTFWDRLSRPLLGMTEELPNGFRLYDSPYSWESWRSRGKSRIAGLTVPSPMILRLMVCIENDWLVLFCAGQTTSSVIGGHVNSHVLDYPGGVGAKGAQLTNSWMFLTAPAPGLLKLALWDVDH